MLEKLRVRMEELLGQMRYLAFGPKETDVDAQYEMQVPLRERWERVQTERRLNRALRAAMSAKIQQARREPFDIWSETSDTELARELAREID